MHYSELHGDLPINAIQAFGGYLAMGGSQAQDAGITVAIATKKITPKQGLEQYLAKFPLAKLEAKDCSTWGFGLQEIVAAAQVAGAITKAQEEAFYAYSRANPDRESVANVKLQANYVEKLFGGGGMSTMTKVLIGVGIAAVVGGGIYYYKTRNED
jgi:hypothetical protein